MDLVDSDRIPFSSDRAPKYSDVTDQDIHSQKESVTEDPPKGPDSEFTFPNLLSEFVYTRTYARFLSKQGRREQWPETVDRYLDFMRSQRSLPESVLQELRESILSLDVLPSMRALWSAGESATRDNTGMYNCSFLPIDSLKSFSEVLYILMQGTGVGFSVERQFVKNLPVIHEPTGSVVDYVVADSTEGWADAFFVGMTNWFLGNRMNYDYSQVRPAGTVLKTKGGRASGPGPLVKLFEFAETTILNACGRQLLTLECHDITCMIAEIVVVGGTRRSSLISISDPDDDLMRNAKNWKLGTFPTIRYMANNSAYYPERPDHKMFWREWTVLKESGAGERGFSIDNWHRRSDRPEEGIRTNPCGEIGLRFQRSTNPWTGEGGCGQFCNLSAAVMRSWDTVETMAKKVRLATWLGMTQATFTYFPYLRPGWKQLCDEDQLLGVDITGQCDNIALSGDAGVMNYLNKVARDTALIASQHFGANYPAAITCGKPSGNSSQFVDCASGFHKRFSPYYFRSVRIAATDPLFELIRDQGVPVFKENGQEHLPDDEVQTWVARFPVKSPDEALFRDDETAIEQCDRYLHIMDTWCGEKGHNQSATIYVREHEWDLVGQWVWDHFDEITGLSFLPYDGGHYRLAPYVEITSEEYEQALNEMPEVDFTVLQWYEQEDHGLGSREYACVGGSCEL